MNNALEKLLNSSKAFLLLAFTLSVAFPVIGGVLHFVSCPAPAGQAYFPIVSARCAGEFIGDIGIFCFGLPGLILSFFATFFVVAFIQLFIPISTDSHLLIMIVMALIVNFVIYSLGLRFFLGLLTVVSSSKRKHYQ